MEVGAFITIRSLLLFTLFKQNLNQVIQINQKAELPSKTAWQCDTTER